MSLVNFVCVAAGGALGALLRFIVALLLAAPFPWATVLVNISGCIVMGTLSAVFAERWPESTHLRLFLTVGCLGGFTTFSSFAADLGRLTGEGNAGGALLYATLSLALSLGGFFAAQHGMRWVLS
ncbi:MAG TPA: CrcB family protein [Dongiaceae bacterium]|jgi:CrcB protein|nr:CrcB family protein [Dongiaceae bacterium]